MFKVDDIPDQVLRDIAGAYHRRLASTDTESQPADERDFQRACYLRTALEWLALWLNQQPVAPAAHPAAVPDGYDPLQTDVLCEIDELLQYVNPQGKTRAVVEMARERICKLASVIDMLIECRPSAPAQDVVRDAAVGAAIERAARKLPRYYSIEIEVENGAATVRLYDDECCRLDHEPDGETLASEINAATDAAMLAASAQSSKNQENK